MGGADGTGERGRGQEQAQREGGEANGYREYVEPELKEISGETIEEDTQTRCLIANNEGEEEKRDALGMPLVAGNRRIGHHG